MRENGEGSRDDGKEELGEVKSEWVSDDKVLIIWSIGNDHMIRTPASERSNVQLAPCAFPFLFGYCGIVWEGLQV